MPWPVYTSPPEFDSLRAATTHEARSTAHSLLSPVEQSRVIVRGECLDDSRDKKKGLWVG